jgi:hypothetical protein
MLNFFHIWPNFFDKLAVNPFWDLATMSRGHYVLCTERKNMATARI